MRCNAYYIVSLKRQVQCRIAEHKGLSVRIGLPLQSPPFSAIREHSLQYDHIITSQQFKILAKSNETDLRLLESLNIHKYHPPLNTALPMELKIS